MAIGVVFSEKCTGYGVPGHPESPQRVERIRDSLKEAGFRFSEPVPATEEDVLLAHTKDHLETLKKMDYESIETPPVEMEHILLSAGTVIKASETLSFALTRPPGHHAGRDFFEGFCYVNNLAIAVKKLGKKTAILDLDVHHGHGTQDIFAGNPDVLYASIHQSPLYPMTGLKSAGNCNNFPLFPQTPEKEYLKVLEKALSLVKKFRPEVLAISMGFDTYEGDPLAGQNITEEGYSKMGKILKDAEIPVFIALEGGYSEMIGDLCLRFLEKF